MNASGAEAPARSAGDVPDPDRPEFKPHGYNSASPYLIVDDADAALAFIADVFGAPAMRVHRRDDGSIMHAEARIDDTVVMMGQMAGGPDSHVHVYVPDLDALFARAIAAGGTVVQEPVVKDDTDRRGGIRDPQGTTWWLARQEPAEDT